MANKSSNIQIIGVKGTIDALRVFEPTLYKELNKKIRAILNKTRESAKGEYPRGSWTVAISRKSILGSIQTGRGAKAAVWGESAPGVRASIFEFAGSRSAGKTPQAKAMIASLERRYGGTGRFLWDAWDRTGTVLLPEIKRAVNDVEAEMQRRMDMRGGVY